MKVIKIAKKFSISLACTTLLGGVVAPVAVPAFQNIVHAEETNQQQPISVAVIAISETDGPLSHHYITINPGETKTIDAPKVEGWKLDQYTNPTYELTYDRALKTKNSSSTGFVWVQFWMIKDAAPTTKEPVIFTVAHRVAGGDDLLLDNAVVNPGESITLAPITVDGYVARADNKYTYTYDEVATGSSSLFVAEILYDKVTVEQPPQPITFPVRYVSVDYTPDKGAVVTGVLYETTATVEPGGTVSIENKTFEGFSLDTMEGPWKTEYSYETVVAAGWSDGLDLRYVAKTPTVDNTSNTANSSVDVAFQEASTRLSNLLMTVSRLNPADYTAESYNKGYESLISPEFTESIATVLNHYKEIVNGNVKLEDRWDNGASPKAWLTEVYNSDSSILERALAGLVSVQENPKNNSESTNNNSGGAEISQIGTSTDSPSLDNTQTSGSSATTESSEASSTEGTEASGTTSSTTEASQTSVADKGQASTTGAKQDNTTTSSQETKTETSNSSAPVATTIAVNGSKTASSATPAKTSQLPVTGESNLISTIMGITGLTLLLSWFGFKAYRESK